ncbi:hypothetical protein ACKKBG_A05760 [Auxenochlorella protothecoides x Auxenochlorella symbiontica]
MLRQLWSLPRNTRQGHAIFGSPACLGQHRSFKLFEIFRKEGREERVKELQEDLQQGYFDDFREFRDQHGKVFESRLIPVASAQPFPTLTASLPDESTIRFPVSQGAANVTLVAIAFRAGAQDLIEAWSVPFSEAFQSAPNVQLVELALIESVVMRAWPFRSLLLRNGTASQERYHMPVQYLFHFGDAKPLCHALGLTNRLTGYVFLVDGAGRVRWRGSGPPTPDELAGFLAAAEQLAQGTTLGPRPPPRLP